jgi:hypothetical protein
MTGPVDASSHQCLTRFQQGSQFLCCFEEIQPTARSVYASIVSLSIRLIEAAKLAADSLI